MYKTIFFTAEELSEELISLGVDTDWAESYAHVFKDEFPILLSSEIKITVFKDEFKYGFDDYDINLQYTSVQL